MPDTVLPFVFDSADVRGAVVGLDATWREVLTRRDYPLPVQRLLGEAMAAAALLCSTLKFEGSLILQTQASNPSAPVRVMVVECNAALEMRATATLGGALAAGDRHSLRDLVGDGRLVITLDPRDGQAAYQGVVALEGEHLAGALENYMLRSEQLDTSIHLAAGSARAAGLLVQRSGRRRWQRRAVALERRVDTGAHAGAGGTPGPGRTVATAPPVPRVRPARVRRA